MRGGRNNVHGGGKLELFGIACDPSGQGRAYLILEWLAEGCNPERKNVLALAENVREHKQRGRERKR